MPRVRRTPRHVRERVLRLRLATVVPAASPPGVGPELMALFFARQPDADRSKGFATPRRTGRMVRFSTLVILAGVVLLFVPIPPIATILGVLTIAAGVVMRLLG